MFNKGMKDRIDKLEYNLAAALERVRELEDENKYFYGLWEGFQAPKATTVRKMVFGIMDYLGIDFKVVPAQPETVKFVVREQTEEIV